MSAAIISQLRLEIAEYQRNLAKASGEAAKFKQELATKTAGIEEAILGKTQRYQAIINKVRQEARALKAELAQAQSAATGREAMRVMNPDFREFHRHVEAEGKKGAGFLKKGFTSGINAIGGLVTAAGTAGLAGLFGGAKRGLDFNLSLDNAEVGISNVLRRFDGLNKAAGKNEAAKALEKIIELEPVTAGGLEDLTTGFMKTLASAKGVGLTTEQNVILTAKFANAVANAGLQMDQLTQEYRSILTGNITKDSQIAKILGITNEEINQIKQTGGDLFAYLTGKLGEFGEAGDGAQVAISSLSSALSKDLGALTKGAFDEAISGARDLTEWLEANADRSKAAGEALGDYLYVFKDGFKNMMEQKLNDPKTKLLSKIALAPWKAIIPDKESIEMSRLMDEQERSNRRVATLQKGVDDPLVSEEQKVKLREQIRAIREKELEIEREAAQLRAKSAMSDSESLIQARELVELREEGRMQDALEVGQELEAQNEETIRAKTKVAEIQARIREEEMMSLEPSERRLAALRAQNEVLEEMQRNGGLFNVPSASGLKSLAEDRIGSGNFQGALETLEQLQRVKELQKIAEDAITESEREQKEQSREHLDLERMRSEILESETEMRRSQLPLEQQLQQIRAEMGGKGTLSESDLVNERTRLEIQREILGLRQQESSLVKQIGEEAKQQALEQKAQERAMNDYNTDMDIIRAELDGQKERAEQLRQEQRIQEEQRRIKEAMNVSEAEALRMAREKVELEARLRREQQGQRGADDRYDENGRRRSDGRKRIDAHIDRTPGSRRGRLSDTFSFPGLDALDDMQKRPLRDSFRFPGLDGLDEMRKRAPGIPSPDGTWRAESPMARRARENDAANNAPAPTSSLEQTVIQHLPQILAALTDR